MNEWLSELMEGLNWIHLTIRSIIDAFIHLLSPRIGSLSALWFYSAQLLSSPLLDARLCHLDAVRIHVISGCGFELNEMNKMNEMNELNEMIEFNEFNEMNELNELNEMDEMVELNETNEMNELHEMKELNEFSEWK